SVTIMILMRRNMLNDDRDTVVKAVGKNLCVPSRLSCVFNTLPITRSCERNRAVAWSETGMHAFFAELKKQRWDDHRYYHHSRINQTLHLVSALSFLTAYVYIFTSPVAAALIGWLVAMVTRQVGHFVFEPKDYDQVNHATHAHKEDIKVGYNLQRKVVLLSIWGASPLVLWLDPTLFGIFHPARGHADFVRHVCQVWLA